MNRFNAMDQATAIYNLEKSLERYKRANKNLKRSLTAMTIVSVILLIMFVAVVFDNTQLENKVKTLTEESITAKAAYVQLVIDYDNKLAEQQKKHEKQLLDIENKYINILHMTTDWKELAATVQGEAGGEGLIGMKHVASTVVNRVKTDHWGPTILDVISAPGQYCAYGQTCKEVPPDVAQAIDEVLLYGTTNDAIFYMNPKYSAPSSRSWMRTKPFLLKYGHHEFYGG